MPSTGPRPISEWTEEAPATRAELEAELEKHRGESIVIAHFGGAAAAAFRKAYYVPLQETFGIAVIEDSGADYGKLRGQAETGNIQWHIVNAGTGAAYGFGPAGIVEELDFSIIDHRNFLEALKNNKWGGGGGTAWSTVMAYSTEAYPDPADAPKSWGDFFDADFPGRRGIRGWYHANLVFALLGDNPDLLNTEEGRASLSAPTDEQIDRAFEVLSDFKPNIDIFWVGGSDCPQLLLSGELDMCSAWNGRIFDAQQAGSPITICWECGYLLSSDANVIPNGLKEQDPNQFELAQLVLAWISLPEISVEVSKYISYGPVNLDAVPLLNGPGFEAVKGQLPTSPENIPFAILEHEEWTGEHQDEWSERFQAFLQE